MAQLTIFVNQKPMLLTDEEGLYFAPPAVYFKSYIYCKAKNETDVLRIINICEADEKLEIALLYNASMEELKKMFWEHCTPVHAAGGVVLNEKQEVLLIERKGKWDLPKGKAEKNETAEQTAIREVQEETGLKNLSITKNICTTYHTYKEEEERILKVNDWFEMLGNGTEKLTPQAEEHITDLKWIPKSELKNFVTATYPSLMQLLEKYEA